MSYPAYPNRADMSAVVDAARRGDRAATDEVVSHCLPLVYNIVGRALNRSADVDDVVQNTMLSVVRGLPGVREPRLFRSWLVAVTMNEIRTHTQRRPTTPAPPEDIDNVIDPRADFEDLTLTQLRLADQRREVVLATRWLDDDHRHLLSLWWLVEAGHLTRADLVDALRLEPHHVTVRVSRMKAQLDTARLVVRALTARPGCAGLRDTASGWNGQPAPLWRKRFARHLRDCAHCPDATSDLVPAERLLAGLALTPPPAALASDVTQKLHAVASVSPVAPAGTHAVAAGARSGLSLSKTLVGVAAAVAVLGGGGLILANYPSGSKQQPTSVAASQPATATTAPALTPSPTAASPTAALPSPTPSRAAKPSKSPKPTPSPVKSTATSNGLSAAERRLLVLLNERRRALGLTEVKLGAAQHREAESCVRRNLNASGLQHCGHEVLFASSGNSSPEQMIEAWFNSPGHKTALTYASSRFAGPAIVFNGSRQVAAINIDY
ncbi:MULTISPECIES: sigma-70 family RNA polymerase sigma factor [unclassified Micromonospora]|uniref:sigma-70 family RNA polymerase sigma factor n=1 Tax=Micromonospora TaxID=1873 RepID=UPI000AD8A806|nr:MULTISPECIES: sigma-70 family RNA polymerase sigma factor [unclassified Micromonospora]WBB83609.1 sigma-70 family RNA polymerase sigma factor [Micromonospora sp. WMMC264]